MLSKTFLNKGTSVLNTSIRCFSTTYPRLENHRCKLLVVGGGSGGCTMSAKFANDFKEGELIVIEPSDVHYYQPMFTLVGGGIKKLKDTFKYMKDVLPKKSKWLKDEVIEFNPENNTVTTKKGDLVTYDFMLVAAGLQLNFDEIPGLTEALSMPDSGVCSNYSPNYVNRTYEIMQKFESGNAIFTYPNTPVKCPGAPQKICYISEHYFRNVGKRDKANIIYNTSLPVIFSAKTYADALWKVVEKRGINVNLRTNLIEIKPKEKIAVFQNLDKSEEKTVIEYSMLHVAPPMSSLNVIKKCKALTNELGFIDVNKNTLQHVKFSNVFAIGDCGSTPNPKTAASIAGQSNVVYKNMKAAMAGQKLQQKYDGYTSCPLVTGYSSCILAEFDYDFKPLETFPVNQDKEMWIMYAMKKDVLPSLYWNFMLNGNWSGPSQIRKLLHLGLKN